MTKFYTNVVHKLKEENATDCQINDVKKRLRMSEGFVEGRTVIVKLEGAQATNLSKTVASNMLNFVDLLFRQPVDSKTNAMANNLQNSQLELLVSQFPSKAKIPILVFYL
ncbi:hypothetical protein L596_021467 [Steinernema carpocapsae]|uniref:Uncharacterized protein n=1 Tax=Steinernema carpocapsae TaxID=34508 RepID=A0A4U5MIT6_STECR|nr:hypothetical protein L596_021467 [Steinernema carpocapsae]